jgi:hypothetical protein
MNVPPLPALLLLCAIASAVQLPAYGLSCGEISSGTEPGAVAFVGVATRIRPAVELFDSSPYTPVDFRVERTVHGDVPQRVTVMTTGDFADRHTSENPRSLRFVHGHRYHVVAFRGPDGVVTTGGCTTTHRITIPPGAQPYVYGAMSVAILVGIGAAVRWLRAF